jgi:hypothetical protein
MPFFLLTQFEVRANLSNSYGWRSITYRLGTILPGGPVMVQSASEKLTTLDGGGNGRNWGVWSCLNVKNKLIIVVGDAAGHIPR